MVTHNWRRVLRRRGWRSISGFRANLGVGDDLFGSREDAYSDTVRQKRWDWYVDDFSARLKPGAKRILMNTRWHEEDVAGRVLEQIERKEIKGRVISISAIAEENDPLGRKPGEYLWDDPSGYDYGAFLRARQRETSPMMWSALYQQRPAPEDGDYFKAAWLKPCDKLPARETMRIYGGSDYAGKPLAWAEEKGQISAGVGPALDRRQRERQAWCYRQQFPTRGDKAVRAQSIRGRMALEGLYVPTNAVWFAEFKRELLSFPAGKYDDQVDALGLIGQLIDQMVPGQKPRQPDKPKVDSGYRPIGL